jgi:acetyl-CoA carboxylase biotin carboxyl carrier protein
MQDELTHEDVKKIVEIVDASEHLQDIEIVLGGVHLRLQRGHVAETPPAARLVNPQSAAHTANAVPIRPADRHGPVLAEGEVAVRAPMLGTFYRSSTPGKPPFIEVGQRVRSEDTVCLIEVMKLFNSIKAGVDGVVTRILSVDGKLVEYDEILIVVSVTA